MSQKNLLLIVNPNSGKAKMRGALLQVVEILSAGGYEVTVYPTKERGDATKKIINLQDGYYDVITVCGGDGTLNEVISGLMLSGKSYKLGYIPSGTLNEWSSGLHIPKNIPAAAKSIVSGDETVLDVGQFNDRFFSYTASFGAFTEASYSAPQDVKNVLGQAAYFFEGIKCLGNIKPIHLKLHCDEQEIEGDFLFGAVSNSMSVGGIVKFKEAVVELNDGFFEVMLIRNPANISQFQGIVDAILRQDLKRDGIEFFHTKSLTIEGSENTDWTLDGEYAKGAEKITINNLHNAIRLITPPSK